MRNEEMIEKIRNEAFIIIDNIAFIADSENKYALHIIDINDTDLTADFYYNSINEQFNLDEETCGFAVKSRRYYEMLYYVERNTKIIKYNLGISQEL